MVGRTGFQAIQRNSAQATVRTAAPDQGVRTTLVVIAEVKPWCGERDSKLFNGTRPKRPYGPMLRPLFEVSDRCRPHGKRRQAAQSPEYDRCASQSSARKRF